MPRVAAQLLAVAWAWLGLSGSLRAQLYSLTDLGVLTGGNLSRAAAINNSGQITGDSAINTDNPPDVRVFRWQGSGPMTMIGTPPNSLVPGSGGTYSAGRAINGSGHIIGVTNQVIGSDSYIRGFYFNGSTMAFVPNLPGGSINVANDISNSGVVTGYANLDPDPVIPPYVAYTWDSTTNTLTQLPMFYSGASFTIGYGINSSGRVVGSGEFNTNGLVRAFFWDPADTSLTPIPVLPPYNGIDDPTTFNNFANRVNESGNIIGISDVSDFLNTGIFRQHAFLYLTATNTLIDIGTLGGNLGEARGINSFNVVVGFSNLVNDGPDRAFIYTQSGGIVDLNTLLDSSGAGWTLLRAEAINDDGWIVGFGLDPNDELRGFLLRPAVIPEPTTWALIGTLTAAVGGYTWHRRREARISHDEDSGTIWANNPPSSAS